MIFFIKHIMKFEEIAQGQPLLGTKFQELKDVRNNLIGIPKLFLGDTRIDKTVANYYLPHQKECKWLNHNFGSCPFQ